MLHQRQPFPDVLGAGRYVHCFSLGPGGQSGNANYQIVATRQVPGEPVPAVRSTWGGVKAGYR